MLNDSLNSSNISHIGSIIKIVFAGDSYVGKTNLFTWITDNTFELDSKATIGVDFKLKNVWYLDNDYWV